MLLGVVESVTEFLPVSSTGHLILLSEVLGFVSPENVFQIAIQSGAVLSVCVLYFARLWRALRGVPSDPQARRFALSIVIAFIPAAIFGASLHGLIKGVLFSPVVVGYSMLVGGIAILMVEGWRPAPTVDNAERLPLRTALGVGLFQCLALIPGVSRSGATIMGALLMRVDRKAAAEFSFFLAIPTVVGAAVYDVYKNADSIGADDVALMGVGLVSAFVVGLFVIKGLIEWLKRYSYRPFGWYRIALGLIVIWATSGS